MSPDTRDPKQLVAERRVPVELLPRLIELATDAVIVVNSQGRIVLASKATERLFGYQQDELVGPVPSVWPIVT